MADGIVSAVVETVLGLLSSAALQEIGALWGLKNELESLESILCTVQLVLQDAEIMQRKSQALQSWLRKLKYAAYDAENVLDRVATEGLKRRADSARGMQRKLNSFLSKRNPLLFRLKMVNQVRNIRGRLDALAKERFDFHLGDVVVENRFGESFDSRQTSSLVNELYVYGRNEEKEMIVEKMLDAVRDQDDLSVYARHLQERLRGKLFLLVLDDVWSEKHELWDKLREVLRCGLKGSVLIATTRIEKVALMMATIGVHQIGYLSKDDSWSLFRQRAFTNRDAKENLVPIGKAIVKKCGGVPLAIKALGSLMQFKSLESEWLAIRESEIWQLSDDENGILPALRLSYYNLPAMRQCFAYCSLFPKDYVMEKKDLVQLWMANGFVPSQGQSDLNLIGHWIFNELVCRSFLQIVRTDYRGEVTCKMHDLMHDLAVLVMGQETYVLEHDKLVQTLKLMNSFTLLELPKGMKVMRNLWFLEIESHLSLICTPPGLGDLIHLHELSIFIVGRGAAHQIDQLKELNLGGSLSIKGLENVSSAEDAKRANLIKKNNLTSLSLLWTNEINNNYTENYEEVLKGLQPHQNLERIYIQSYQGSRFPNWMSTLELKNLKEVTLEDCRRCDHLPMLGKLPSLTNLKLYRMDSIKSLDVEFHGDGECVFPALEELRISEMPNLEEWKIGNSVESFPRLKDLDICELPVFPGGFLQNLQNLQIGSSMIRTISNVLDDLSALKTLSLYGCSNLESLPDELKNLNSLEELEVKGCDGLISFPAVILEDLSSLRSLSFENCKKLKPLSGRSERPQACSI
ncbi:putative disease resistance protein RGA1 [Sesamum angolense]|uniref:Disease resistance protein RGA1 n=1 Tax=Sesamum angolense TaxID=2727404 RepID=A0AAE2C5S0_9LAMI|nr:putative disease resistance protein RGA1 [Sesamum angolense]